MLSAVSTQAVDSIRVDRISTQQGLSQGTIQAFAQDGQGFMWVATQEGLNRFDGYEFTTFQNDPDDPRSLSHSWVRTLLVDSKNRLWVGSDRGDLDRFEPNTRRFVRQPMPGEDHGALRDIVEDHDGLIWIATQAGGVLRFDPSTGEFTSYRYDPNDPFSLSSDEILDLEYDPATGMMWCATSRGLNRLHLSTDRVERLTITQSLRAVRGRW